MRRAPVVMAISAAVIVVGAALLALRLAGFGGHGPAKRPPKAGIHPQLIWRFKTRGNVVCQPVVRDGMVYVGSGDGNLYALALPSGTEVWYFRTGGGVDGAPLIDGNTLYFGSGDGNLYALDLASGRLKWAYPTAGQIVSTPLLLRGEGNGSTVPSQPSGDRIVVGSYDCLLHCVDAGTGRELWTYESNYYINGSPVLAGNDILFGGCDSLLHAVSRDGRPIGTVDLGSYVIGTAAVRDGLAYVGQYDGWMYCIDIARFAVKWRRKMAESPEDSSPPAGSPPAASSPAGGNGASFGPRDPNVSAYPIFSSPAVDDKRVIFGSQDGNVYCLDRVSGGILWHFTTEGQVNGSPILAGGMVFIGSEDNRFYALRVEDGKEVWDYETGYSISGKAAVTDDMVIFGSYDDYIYAVKRDLGAGGPRP